MVGRLDNHHALFFTANDVEDIIEVSLAYIKEHWPEAPEKVWLADPLAVRLRKMLSEIVTHDPIYYQYTPIFKKED